jgi:hypothetical protein
MTATAVLFATAPAADGGPTAFLRADGAPLAGRLVAQLATLGVRRSTVVTRPAWADAARAALGDGGDRVDVVVSDDLAGDLAAAASAARQAHGTLVVARADLLVHREALAGLLANPGVVTGILSTGSSRSGRWAFRTRSLRGRVVAASSPYHRVRRPNHHFLGVLKVDARDLEAFAGAAARLGELTAVHAPDAEPDGPWAAELARKVGDWRRWLWQVAEEERTGVLPPGDEAPEHPPVSAEDEATLALRERVSREDAPAMLLVGLVRSGVHVGNAYLRGFFHARPASRAAAAEAEAELAERDEDKIALDSAVKAADGFFTTFFVSPYSRYIARWCARHGLTPNQMTTVSMGMGLVAAALFALGSRPGLVGGAVVLQAAFTIDCVDGQLARYTRQFSKLGAWLDSIFDRAKEYVVYVGLALGATRGFGDDVWTLAVAALALQTARHQVDFGWGATRQQAIAALPRLALEQTDELAATAAPSPRRAGSLAPAPARPAPAAAAAADADAVARPAAPTTPTAVADVPEPGTADVLPGDEEVPPAPRGLPGLARRGVSLITGLERWTATRWAKRIFSLPIGERFALISITAALWDPRTTFTALLAWGGAAAVYQVGGRLLRSVAR